MRVPLRSMKGTVLAFTLAMTAGSAHAQVVTLHCQNSNAESYTGNSSVFRVDYDRKTVQLLRSDGTATYSAAAAITEGAIEWRAALDNPRGSTFTGSLNRVSGQIWSLHPVVTAGGRVLNNVVSGPCRRATQKF